ncbi:MAG TPA: amidohydrolase family protein [Vitreimonas sp.]|uniref:amidohydrolase family protein n=1 Tax=Vitreimonas sp. TaxID=3069702 RepID=UPI002D65C016|nr:amidohydrolase family protein [Vitreimonas sp.]HYD86360.1 amidohydrolase family protein [Vitreimonas sp.]
MWDTLWVNANLATMIPGGAPYGAIQRGAVAAKDGKIAWVGYAADLPGHAVDLAREVRRCENAWITPGLVDCHTHLVFGGDRAREFEMRLQGKSYEEIARASGGIVSTVAATRAASREDLVASAAKRLAGLTREGVTTVEIKSGYGLDLETEIKMLEAAKALETYALEPSPPLWGRGQGEGARAAPDRLNAPHPPAPAPQGGGGEAHIRVKRTFLGLHALPPEFRDDRAAYVQLVADGMIPAIAAAGLADAVDAFCENIGFTAEEVDYVFSAACANGLQVKLHAEQISNQNGAALAARYNALSADHLEYLADAGIHAMVHAGTVAVLLPGAFYFLREKQLPPIDKLRAAGVHMAVASDCNPGTSPMTSPLAALNMACTLFRLTPEEALAGITREGARALGMLDDVGTLEVGKVCDLAVWDVNAPAELSYWLGAPLLKERVFGGRVV